MDSNSTSIPGNLHSQKSIEACTNYVRTGDVIWGVFFVFGNVVPFILSIFSQYHSFTLTELRWNFN